MSSISEQILPFFKPNEECLSNQQLSFAVRDKVIAYPEVVRSITDPRNNDFVLLSFLTSPEHNYVKVRGCGSLPECKEKAKEIIKSVDSRFPIAIAKLGQWCYITSDPEKVSKETIKIIDEKEVTHDENVDLLIKEHENRGTVEEPKLASSILSRRGIFL